MDKTATFAKLTLDVKAGDYDLETWLIDENNQKGFGACFVYVSAE